MRRSRLLRSQNRIDATRDPACAVVVAEKSPSYWSRKSTNRPVYNLTPFLTLPEIGSTGIDVANSLVPGGAAISRHDYFQELLLRELTATAT